MTVGRSCDAEAMPFGKVAMPHPPASSEMRIAVGPGVDVGGGAMISAKARVLKVLPAGTFAAPSGVVK